MLAALAVSDAVRSDAELEAGDVGTVMYWPQRLGVSIWHARNAGRFGNGATKRRVHPATV